MPISAADCTHVTDDRSRHAVLLFLRESHPAMVLAREIVQALAGGGTAAERDAIDRAIRDLHAVGVLHRLEDFVVLSLAAVQTAELCDL